MPPYLDRLPEDAPADLNPDLAADLLEMLQHLAGFGAALAARIAVEDASGGALQAVADDMARASLTGTAARFLALAGQEPAATPQSEGSLAVVIDPLNGAAELDADTPPGTIFGIFRATEDATNSLLRPARDLLASGYVIHGPQGWLMLRVGAGRTRRYLLDRDSAQFRDLGAVAQMPSETREYAINAANYRHWPMPIRAYIDDRLAGTEGPIGRDFNMRWTGSLVAEAQRILQRGGVFLSPGDSRTGQERGRLRLIHECGPISHLIEGAGGRASDGLRPILELMPAALDQRTPFVFGGADEVAQVAAYFGLPEDESALFNRRGLFRH